MPIRRALRRFAMNVRPVTSTPALRYRNGTIATVTAGGAVGGSDAAVTVTVGADTFPAPYLKQYSPAVGDTVAVLLVGSSPLILGVPAGLPVF